LHQLDGWQLARAQDRKGVEHDFLRETYSFKNYSRRACICEQQSDFVFATKCGRLAGEEAL